MIPTLVSIRMHNYVRASRACEVHAMKYDGLAFQFFICWNIAYAWSLNDKIL